eukprot:scaffold52874_cov55-Attheya_sp.AAC.1
MSLRKVHFILDDGSKVENVEIENGNYKQTMIVIREDATIGDALDFIHTKCSTKLQVCLGVAMVHVIGIVSVEHRNKPDRYFKCCLDEQICNALLGDDLIVVRSGAFDSLGLSTSTTAVTPPVEASTAGDTSTSTTNRTEICHDSQRGSLIDTEQSTEKRINAVKESSKQSKTRKASVSRDHAVVNLSQEIPLQYYRTTSDESIGHQDLFDEETVCERAESERNPLSEKPTKKRGRGQPRKKTSDGKPQLEKPKKRAIRQPRSNVIVPVTGVVAFPVPDAPPRIVAVNSSYGINTGDTKSNRPFSKENFMSNSTPLFHLNPFINSKVKRNKGFGPFLREQAVTIGFQRVSSQVVDLVSNGSSKKAIREEIVRSPLVDNDITEARQVAQWLIDVKVGSYIVMRHTYKECPCIPNKLKDENGVYIGPVYVIGVVTQIVEPNSAEDRTIAKQILEVEDKWNHSYYRVGFCKMGIMASLQPETIGYISKICQPTLQRICQGDKSWPRLGTNSKEVRTDLWTNAVMDISKDDFPDRFGTAADMPYLINHPQ